MAVFYNPRMVTDGLVLCLDAANLKSYPGTGITWSSVVGAENSGIFVNGPVFGQENSGYIDFDGTDDYFEISTPTMNVEYPSHEIWFKLDSPTNSIAQNLFARRNTSNGTYNIVKNASNRFSLNIRNTSDTQFFSGNINFIPTTDWTSIVFTYDGTTIKAYVNGFLDRERSDTGMTGPINTGGDFQLRIFRNTGTNLAYADGKVAIARVYNRALSAEEVLQNFNATRGRFGL